MQQEKNPGGFRLAAWGVHFFTASGALFGLLALLAVENGHAKAAFLWMLVTLVIDGLDGPLARLVHVREVLPRIDGVNLDLIVDYLTYVIVPALFFYRFNLLPENWNLFAAALVLVASQYHSANLDQKTPDYYFRGFPAWWNVLAFYLYVFHPPAWINLALVVFFAISTFVPGMLFLHPLRAKEWKAFTIGVLAIWTTANIAILLQLPTPSNWLLWLSLAGLIYLMARCVIRMVTGAAPQNQSISAPATQTEPKIKPMTKNDAGELAEAER